MNKEAFICPYIYKEKFYCLSCDRGITKAVNKYLGRDKNE